MRGSLKSSDNYWPVARGPVIWLNNVFAVVVVVVDAAVEVQCDLK